MSSAHTTNGSRREFLNLSGALIAASALGSVALAEDQKGQGHQHAGHGAAKPVRRKVSKELAELRKTTAECLRVGQICLAECNISLATGDTSMAECQVGVMEMLAVVEATGKIAAYNFGDGVRLKALAKVCADYCRACEKSCKPHSEAHRECKDCMEACARCAKACDAIAA